MYNIRSGAIRWQIPDFLSDGNSNVCSSSHHLRDIRETNKIKIVWPWKWRSKSKSRRTGLTYWICLIPYSWIFIILENWEHSFSQKETHTHTNKQTHTHKQTNTHTHTRAHTHAHTHIRMCTVINRETGVMTIGKIWKQICKLKSKTRTSSIFGNYLFSNSVSKNMLAHSKN